MLKQWIILAVLAGVLPSIARGDDVKPDQMKKQYDSALEQLKAAQDRKNELATENDKLNAKVADLQKKLDDAARREATFAETTFEMKSTQLAWQQFLKRYPTLAGQWQAFLQVSVLSPASLPSWNDAWSK